MRLERLIRASLRRRKRPFLNLVFLSWTGFSLLNRVSQLWRWAGWKSNAASRRERPNATRTAAITETRTELGRTTARTPELHGQRDALEIERCNPALPLLPTNADQELSTSSVPTDLKMLSPTFLLREHFQGGRDAGSTGRVGEPPTPDSPKEAIH